MKVKETTTALKGFWALAGEHRRAFALSFGLMFITLATELSQPIILDKAVRAMTTGDAGALESVALTFLGVILLDYLSRGGFTFLFSLALLKTINKIRGMVFHHVIHMKMAFFDKQPVGRLLTRTINDCEALAETLRAGAATIALDFCVVVGLFVVMCTYDFGLSMAMVLTAPVIMLIVRWCAARLKEKFLDVRKALAESNGFMAEGIMGVEILQLFQKEQTSSKAFGKINRKYCRATIVSNFYDALLYAFIDGVAALITALILFVSLNLRFDAATVATTTATLIVYLRMVEKIFIPIRDFSGKYAVIQQGVAAIERIKEVLDNNQRIEQGETRLKADRLSIRTENLSFRYSQDGPLVLRDINLEVAPGQSLALVGMTGSGKSTIGKLLTRAYDGYEGQIRINDVEIGEYNYHDLRSHIAVVHQDVELFPGTLRDNITMFNPKIGEDRIMEAIRMVKAEHMVAGLPGGLDYQVHESGSNLSTGQVQLIVFARALAHDAPVVLMDEATASVDSVTEAWIQEAVAQVLQHKTTIVVAHRLSTIAAADTILVMKDGEIIERGNHAHLTGIENGYYASLVKASQLQQGNGSEVLL